MNDPFLQEQATELNTILRTTRERFLPLSDEQKRWKPAADQWSIAEVFDHLYITGALYEGRIEGALATTLERGWKGETFRPSFTGRLFHRALTIKMRVKAPKMFQPAQAEGELHSLQEYIEQQEALLELIRKADGYSLTRARFASPATRLLRFNLGDGIRMMVTHQKRHLAQAQRVFAAME